MHQIIFSLCYVKNMDTEASDLQMADIYWDNTIEQRPHLLVSLVNQVTLGDHRKLLELVLFYIADEQMQAHELKIYVFRASPPWSKPPFRFK